MIECVNVQKNYGAMRVLTGLKLTIEEPKIVALVGRNGAGKSTLMKMLAGHLKPNSGEIRVAGLSPFNNLTVATNTVFIEESMPFSANLTLNDILKAAKAFYPNWQHELAIKLTQFAQLDLNALYQSLSKGQGATLRLIYGLCARCAYTYLDEPMNGMDEGIRADFYRAILKEFIAAPRMIIISTHYLNEIRSLVEDVVILHDGKIEMHITADELAEFATKVTGPKQAVKEAIGQATVIYAGEEKGFYEAYVVASELEQQKAETPQILVQPVEAHVVARILTTNRQGGIDDVYQ